VRLLLGDPLRSRCPSRRWSCTGAASGDGDCCGSFLSSQHQTSWVVSRCQQGEQYGAAAGGALLRGHALLMGQLALPLPQNALRSIPLALALPLPALLCAFRLSLCSKTHCPYCMKAKSSLNQFLQPSQYTVIEVGGWVGRGLVGHKCS
jgi:hypothetical protein